MKLPSGTRLGTYEIVSLLGDGGMGEVYRAQDTRLGRDVAIKVVSEHVGEQPELLARFEREAKTLAALNHPNIAMLYGFEQEGDRRYLVMELVDGDTLDQQISSGGLSSEEFLEYAVSLADALAEAHSEGIVHRDLKPSNVMVSSKGRLKVLDFGLAKLVSQEEDRLLDSFDETKDAIPELTRAGAIVGTFPYMPPEQLIGQQADARSDVYSLGVVLFEMATGRRPFEGSGAQLASAILRDEPASVSESRPELPATVSQLIARCLAKSPAARPSDASEVRDALAGIGPRSPSPGEEQATRSPKTSLQRVLKSLAKLALAGLGLAGVVWLAYRPVDDPGQAIAPVVAPSIAVLPFEDFSQGGDQEYFANGISEELLNLLARVKDLRVVSRTSAFAFKGKDTSVGEIAEALNVSHILEGSIRKSGTTLRITGQLIAAATDQPVWSETYERALTAESIFAIQDEIAQAIVAELQGRMDLPSTDSALQTASTEAYDAYLRGRTLIAQRTPETISEGLAELNRAATLDPDFALAQAALVEAYILSDTYSDLSSEQAVARATPHADRAMALAPGTAESLTTYGWLLDVAGDYEVAIAHFERAIAANPNLAEVWRRLGLSYRKLNRFDKSKEAFERAYQLDPLAPIVLANWSIALLNQGDLAASGAVARDAERLYPDDVVVRAGVADALWYEADFAGAHRIWKNDEAVSGRARRNLAYVYDEIGLPHLAAPRATPEIRAVMALREGGKTEAQRQAREDEFFPSPILLAWVREMDEAYASAKAAIERQDLLSDEVTLSPPSAFATAYYLDILSAHDDPDADVFEARLAAQFEDRVPADFQAPDSLYAGAKWHTFNDDVEGALLWLDELVDRGHIWRDIDVDPMFDPVRASPGFRALLSKRAETAARHREAIEAQLADPDPNWLE